MVAVLVAAGACGGKSATEPAAKPADTNRSGDTHAMGEQGEPMSAPVARFHDTLAPRWHAAQGPQRMTDTCGAIGQLHTEAGAIVAAPAPQGANAAAWAEGGKQLAEAVTALDATCQAKDAAAFEPAFARVHKSFHHVMEAAGPHGPEHGEHGDHGEHKM